MGRLTNTSRDLDRWQRYADLMRKLCELRLPGDQRAADVPGCPFPEQLRRLEAGESVIVQGWEIGVARDDGRSYLMDAYGRLTVADDH